jgi:chemotaxis protein CheD
MSSRREQAAAAIAEEHATHTDEGDGFSIPVITARLWQPEIGGAEARPMTLESLRQVAMPGGEVPLMPGELFFGGAPARLTTLLGACVSVTLWHRASGSGGICHFLYPEQQPEGPRPDGRYGKEALALLAASVVSTGSRLADCEIKIFGGGGVLEDNSGPPALLLGTRNVDVARQWAAAHGLSIAAEDVGGCAYRRITFDLDTGAVEVFSSRSVSLAWASETEKEIR